jgi:cyclic beta-1,2-glucan synthetase
VSEAFVWHEEAVGPERLEQYAAHLAALLSLRPRMKRARSLVPEIRRNTRTLFDAYIELVEAIREKHPVSPAAEWFVDNFHIIENQLRDIRRDLPEGYYRGLPQLLSGTLEGYPRVYAIASAIAAHTDCRLDLASIQRFLIAFQSVARLEISEIWALSITLRIVLIQELAPLASRIVEARESRRRADSLADRILSYVSSPDAEERELIRMLTNELGSAKEFDRACVVQLIQRLRDQDPNVWPAFDWLEHQLGTLSTSAERVTQLEHRAQAAAQVTVGNIINSMRMLSIMDWRELFENVSETHRILALDPAGAYAAMDFATRDRYRHAVERIAKRSKLSESAVAEKLIEVASHAPEGSLARHVGYHLIDRGKRDFDRLCGYRPRYRERAVRFIRNYPTFFYLGLLTVFTSVLLAFTLFSAASSGASVAVLILFGIVSIFPASEFALSLLNHYVHFFVPPSLLPRMETERGVPTKARTMIMIPTLFTKESVVRELVERLEVHWLANPDPSFLFALLGDYGDADRETLPEDEALLKIAQAGIDDLNSRYPHPDGPRFHLFLRKRLWNSSEEKWIGWERKRGKILEFNRLIRGATDTSYIHRTAEPGLLAKIEYVITLDSDTQLPRDVARKLLGAILHPLNRPQFDAKRECVTQGYGILQPRISITASSALASRFAQISSGNIGLDPYTTAVSDVYQDVFGEGSFTGKGLYVVDAFELALADRVPENAILSHDLFEGSYARSALVTDVELFDDYPADYDTFLKRLHRWTRGDWQIAPWIFGRVPVAGGGKARNPLSLLSRWKIFDNLRRSLVAPATLLWLLLAWTVMPGTPALWTAGILLVFLFPVYSTLATGNWLRRGTITWNAHILGGIHDTRIKLAQIFVTLAYLPEHAWTQVDAITRVFYRLCVSRKKLLEWVSFAQVSSQARGVLSARDFFSPGPALAIAFSGILVALRAEAMPVAFFFLVVWVANPFLKFWLRERSAERKRPLETADRREFRLYARSTWRFFESFVGDVGNWLAPDNFQENPNPVVAHRTSPTNVGLQLLASASAYDFGFLGRRALLERTEKTFATLGKLERMHGHFFNWYDTQSLEPLRPQYVSTVDSGNIGAHLIAFKQFLLAYANAIPSPERVREGLLDVLLSVREELALVPGGGGALSIDGEIVRVRAASFDGRDEVSEVCRAVLHRFSELEDELRRVSSGTPGAEPAYQTLREWITAAVAQTSQFLEDAEQGEPEDLSARVSALVSRCDRFVEEMDFRFLYDEQRKLFSIGFNVTDHRRDNSYYDLLASEARLTSFLAIAKGDVPQEHWFRLGRQMAALNRGGRALIAWTATMFEYLMPLLVMRRHPNSLLDQTCEAIVRRQIEYGDEKGVPWGVSESGYHARDLNLNYQYGPFGIPGLGLKRGLSEELVISPYSTMLAALVDPLSALENLRRLRKMGAYSRFGFYEAIDYTAERLPKGRTRVILHSYMAHHQGMSLVALDNLLHDFAMQERFHADPLVQATELLLQEKMPQAVPLVRPRAEEVQISGHLYTAVDGAPRAYSDVHLTRPRSQLLSNGNYCVMVTSSGAGYSRCGKFAITRWREDSTRDNWGSFLYIRNLKTGRLWSAAHQPIATAPHFFEASLNEEKVEFTRKDGRTTTRTEVIVSPEDNVELRRVTLTNESPEARDFEVTSFMEIVLAKPADDQAHPAFSNLFVQTEFVAEDGALLATRRPRAGNEAQPWAFHLAVSDADPSGHVEYETDRARFLGRGRSPAQPASLTERLSGTVGSVLDPVFALRKTVRLAPHSRISVTFVTGLANSRAEAMNLIGKYRSTYTFAREAEFAWTQSRVQLRHLNVSTAKAHLYQKLGGRILYLDSALRPSSHSLSQNSRMQSNLWTYGISGDLPIVLVQIVDEKDMPMVRELLHAHEYLRLKGLVFDLVILNERSASYIQSLQEEILRQVRMSGSHALLDKAGGVFARRVDLMPKEDVTLLRAAARLVLNANLGPLEELLKLRKASRELPENLEPSGPRKVQPAPEISPPALEFFNGLGGFADTREYVIVLHRGQWTPAPWVNVVANDLDFGFVISESGAGYTWSVNSRENRLTPWSNDPVTDPVGEAIYLRDDETGEFWSPTPLPIRESEPYIVRHGQGYSRFEHTSHGIEQSLDVFVALDASVKMNRLRLRNTGTSSRTISVFSYVEWVLGVYRAASAPYVIGEVDMDTGALIARNPYNNEFAGRIAFADISAMDRTHTCDRQEFFGRNRTTANPAALERVGLSGSVGAGLDPCAAFHTTISLAPGEERTLVITLGQAESIDAVRALVRRFRDPRAVDAAYVAVGKFWEKTLSTITISTPDRAMNALVNRWVLYQTLACRIWARTGFYQSGGAYGFRDQLQDVMALAYSRPEITRAQILRAAARQFKEGDVQHWWHPPTGRGVRTHFSDDLLWLPYVTSFYIQITGDRGILEEIVPFIEAPLLAPGQEDSYTHPTISSESATLREHCARAIDRSLKVGAHGLPLMGSGDWNDGMNRVGHEGRGESVWVAWFLHSTIEQFLRSGEPEPERVIAYREHLVKLKAAIEENAWDGGWYRRAYFDDGTPLGSSANEECRIDAIAQSWSVLSGAGDPERARQAMAAVEENLIDRKNRIIQLFTPPFDRTLLDPGYIKGYLPGVRENGGQYTHAAIWTMMAFAELGEGDKAAELYAILNPINHANTPSKVARYKAEPYVVAADIYGCSPHTGRGGWTWYTGSASWMYRSAIESILGFEVQGDRFRMRPKIPAQWSEFSIRYRYGESTYAIKVMRGAAEGAVPAGEWVPLVDDGQEHAVRISL